MVRILPLLPIIALFTVGIGAVFAQQTISNVDTTDVSHNAATITWTTAEPGDSVVRYRPAAEDTFLTATEPSTGTEHSVALADLSPDTEYLFEVRSTDAEGNTVVDNNAGEFYSFTTLQDPDALTISTVGSLSLTGTSQLVFWQTPVEADSLVRYGTAPDDLAFTIFDSSQVTDHGVTLAGLDPSTRYFFEVESTDDDGNTTTDDNGDDLYSFTTALVIESVEVGEISETSALVTWETNREADSLVRYGTSPADLNFTAAAPSAVTDHSVLLADLSPDTEYFFDVESTDAEGNTTTDDNGGDLYSFTTQAEADLVIADVDVGSITATSALVTWETDRDASSLVRYGTSVGDLDLSATNPVTGTSHAVPLAGLSPDTEYFFEVESTDAKGNTATDDNGGDLYSFTTQAEVDLVIAEVDVQDITETSALVTWETDPDADSLVRYGTSVGDLDLSATVPVTGTSHAVPLAGLTPDTRYFFEVESTDGEGNTVTDNNEAEFYSFTTRERLAGEERRAFVGQVQGEPGNTVTLVLQGTGREVVIVLPDEFELKTPGGPRAGEFEEGAEVVILAQREDQQWVALSVLVKPVRPKAPLIGVIASVDNGKVTITSSDGTTQTIYIPEGIEVSTGDLITVFSRVSGEASGLVKAKDVRKRLEKFLKNVTKDREKALERAEKAAERAEKDARKRRKDFERIERLLEALESQKRQQLNMLDSVIERAPEELREHLRRAREKVASIDPESAQTVERAREDLDRLLDELEDLEEELEDAREREEEAIEEDIEEAEKAQEKAREKAEKEREKAEKREEKAREKAEKEREKAEKRAEKAREKAEKEQKKAEKRAEKAQEKEDKGRGGDDDDD